METSIEQLARTKPEVSKLSASTENAPPSSLRKKSLTIFLLFVVFNTIIFNLAILLFDRYIVPSNQLVKEQGTARELVQFLRAEQGQDSLQAMLPAIHLLQHNTRYPVYQSVFFFQNHTRFFQYPLTSLLPYLTLQRFGVTDDKLILLSKVVTILSVCATVLLTILIAWKFLPADSSGKRNRVEATLVGLGVGLSGFLFYPMMRGASLGQIQTLLTLGFTIAFYCWISGYERTAGGVIGLMIMVKPQYVLFFFWALMRKKFSAFWVGASIATFGFLVSFIVFGWQNNLDYLKVLSLISHHGESYLANQSMNGILNRLMLSGKSMVWDTESYPTYNPLVYYGTVASSLVLLSLAFFWRWGRERRGGVADFACITLAATLASPLAWEHHYGLLLPIFAWLWFSEFGRTVKRWECIVLGTACLLTSNSIIPLAALDSTPALTLFQSYLYYGALATMFLLLTRRSNQTQSSWQHRA